jgi:hypothetical protein
MVKIRYSELPSGLHVSSSGQGRRAIIYLKPGLTPAERRAALIRVRSSGRMGHGPALPPLSMALAIGVDRVLTIARNGAAAMRRHPVLLLPPLILVVSTGIVFILMSFVTLVPHLSQAAGSSEGPGRPKPAVQASGTSPDSPGDQQAAGGSGNSGAGHDGHGGPSPRTSATASTAPSRIQSPAPGSSGSTDPSPTPSSSTSGTPTPDPSTSPSPSPSPSPSSSSSGTCIVVGPLGLCVTL